MSENVYTPVPARPRYFKSNPRAELSEVEQAMYNEVLDHFNTSEYSIPNLEKGELTDDEKFWLSRECILRYLRASKWKGANAAITRLENTLRWRRDYGFYDKLTPEYVEPEAVTGKSIVFGFDVEGKPAIYMIPSRQNTEVSPRQIEFAVWQLERCADLMQPGVENVAWLINYAERAKNPSISTARQLVNILQDHYPERLGLAIAINVPFLISTFFRLVLPFVDPVTRAKLKFNADVVTDGLFDKDMVMTDGWGGAQDFVYEHEKYWPALLKACQDNVTKWMKEWRSLGARVGISEWDYKGGSEVLQSTDSEDEDFKSDAQVVAVVPVLSTPAPIIPEIFIEPTATAFPSETKKTTDDSTATSQASAGHSEHAESTAAAGVATGGGGDGAEGDGGAAAE